MWGEGLGDVSGGAKFRRGQFEPAGTICHGGKMGLDTVGRVRGILCQCERRGMASLVTRGQHPR